MRREFMAPFETRASLMGCSPFSTGTAARHTFIDLKNSDMVHAGNLDDHTGWPQSTASQFVEVSGAACHVQQLGWRATIRMRLQRQSG